MVKKSFKKSKMTRRDIFWEPLTALCSKPSSATARKSSPGGKMPYISLIVLASILPLVGWGVGVSLNPEGWMSDVPLIPYMYIALFAGMYWPVSLTVIFFIIVYIIFTKSGSLSTLKVLSAITFIASLMFSIFMMTLVKDASASSGDG